MAAPKRLQIASGRKRLRISMSSKGVVEAKGKLNKMRQRVTNLRPPLARGADKIMTLMSDSFRSQSDPRSVKWQDLADSTKENRSRSSEKAKKRNKKGELTDSAKKYRKKILGNIKILDDSGRMKNSTFARATAKSIVFGSNVGYFAAHQAGTDKAGRGKNVTIPRRMVAPVEQRAGKWVLIRKGRAKAVFARIELDIRKHVAA